MEDNKDKNMAHGHEHDENCDCGMDHGFETVMLTMEDGEEINCGIIGSFDVDEKEYIALVPLENEEEVMLFAFEEHGEEVELIPIESEEEFEKVSEVFYDLFNDEDDYDYAEYEEDEDTEEE